MPSELIQKRCPVCDQIALRLHRVVDGYEYFDCDACDSISIDPVAIAEIDSGTFVRKYDADYWKIERQAAWERSWGSSLARVAETLLYARLPVADFVDIGTGPGYLLDAVSKYLPASSSKFWGVETFAPDEHSSHPNYFSGALGKIKKTFQAGSCLEVLEHLTPKMARNLAAEMAERSSDGALYIFNTGLPPYVRSQDPDYLDPLKRGHIVSYSLQAVEMIFGPAGFSIVPLVGKDWAFLLEYKSTTSIPATDRIWTPVAENKAILHDPEMGNLMYILGLETARAYRIR